MNESGCNARRNEIGFWHGVGDVIILEPVVVLTVESHHEPD